VFTISAKNWSGTTTQAFSLGNDQSPEITSRDSVGAAAGAPSIYPIFVVTATGYPTPAITETGALPPGVTFKDNGNGTAYVWGYPSVGSDGQYLLTFTATNGVGSPSVQPFRLLVGYIPPSCCSRVADVGDSITWLSGNAIESALNPSYFLQLNGYPGATIANQFPTIEAFEQDPNGAPSDWIIELGTNDMVFNIPNWSAAFQNQISYLSKAHCVVLLTVSPRIKNPATAKLNKMIKATPLSHSNMHVLNWGEIEYQNPAWLNPDGIHPTSAGQTELAKLELKDLKHYC